MPELFGLPVSLNHAGPLVTMGAMLYQVSTLLMLVGLAPQPFLRGKRRTRTRPSRLAFQRSDQRGFFAADERSRAFHQFDVELESAAENVVAQQPVFAGLLDGAVQAMHRQRIFGANVDDSFGRAHHVTADDHAFQQRVRIALDLVAVHVGAGIAFIGIADDVLLIRLGFGQELPLVAGQVSRAAASAQLGGLDLLDDELRPAVDQHLVQRLVPADRDVFLDVIGIDEAAIAQNDLLLAFEERHFVPQRHFGIAVPVLDGRRDVVPLFDFAIDQIGREVSAGDVVQNACGIVRLHSTQDHQRQARQRARSPAAPGSRRQSTPRPPEPH